MIRIIDAATVLKAGTAAKLQNKLWRIHSAFALPSERFGFFALTGRQGGETRDRIAVVKGEIRGADRASLQASPRRTWSRPSPRSRSTTATRACCTTRRSVLPR
jgi:hypothetical protein